MRSRRTWLVGLTALGLIALPLAFLDVASAPLEGMPAGGCQITLLKDGKPVRISHFSQAPRDLTAQFPEIAAGAPFALLVEPAAPPTATGLFGRVISPADRSMIEFLLLLPPATLLVCLFRNVIGLNSFGTFAPALLGLAFRDVDSFLGVFVVLTIISAGWWLRRGLNDLHLLQAPRAALMLSCIVVILLAIIVALSGAGPRAITLFPLVILTGMIERFWSMEEEDGTSSSLGVLASTLFIAGCVWALATVPAVPHWLMRHPETLGPVMAGQLLLGRYTGFRLLELYRFRALAAEPPAVLAAAGGFALIMPRSRQRRMN
jgi:hypothetical protein